MSSISSCIVVLMMDHYCKVLQRWLIILLKEEVNQLTRSLASIATHGVSDLQVCKCQCCGGQDFLKCPFLLWRKYIWHLFLFTFAFMLILVHFSRIWAKIQPYSFFPAVTPLQFCITCLESANWCGSSFKDLNMQYYCQTWLWYAPDWVGRHRRAAAVLSPTIN